MKKIKFFFQENEQGEYNYPIVIQVIEVIDQVIILFFTLEYVVRNCYHSNKLVT